MGVKLIGSALHDRTAETCSLALLLNHPLQNPHLPLQLLDMRLLRPQGRTQLSVFSLPNPPPTRVLSAGQRHFPELGHPQILQEENQQDAPQNYQIDALNLDPNPETQQIVVANLKDLRSWLYE